MKKHVGIIGAGIIGGLIADRLLHYDIQATIIEKNIDGGLEQSMSSSAIVHSGIDPKDGTLKAKLNQEGNEMMAELCKELEVRFRKTGAYMCAKNEAEEETLNYYLAQAQKRNISAYLVTKEELQKIEPNVSDKITKALAMPTTGVIYPMEIITAALQRSIANGLDAHFETEVLKINFVNDKFEVITDKAEFKFDYLINCAGMFSDEIARMVDKEFPIYHKPKRGEYLIQDNKNPIVNSIIYQVPTENGKGVLAVPTVHRNVLLGPNGVMQDDRTDDSTHQTDLKYVQDNLKNILKFIPDDIVRTYAGLRSTGNNNDFYIEYSKISKKMINLACIDSPGFASSPAIAKQVVTMLEAILQEEGFSLNERVDYNKKCPHYEKMIRATLQEQQARIKKNSDYGEMVCRTELVTKGEIIASIKHLHGARDLSGVKFRTKAMTGTCQGACCEIETIKIIAEELNLDLSQIKRRGRDTFIIRGAHEK
ncbi:MAG: NAD(P)/FAD-dependent oxidoreductase [Mycoplasmatales bacterium]